MIPKLREWREWRCLTQTELARRAGLTQTTISRIENGNRAHLSTIRKLAAALGVESKALRGEER